MSTQILSVLYCGTRRCIYVQYVHTLDFGNNIGPDGLPLELREAIRTVTQQIHLVVSWLGSHIFVKVEAGHCEGV